ncbi:MAG TPA: alpha/beta hydrolase [Acidimicrobiales bacterium]|nr:alpha/beta hydrolase [Acidimicrobiales bacterium]
MTAPDWFTRALEVSWTDETVRVTGTDIHYLAWGERGQRGLLFVHGGGAHAHWWTHIAASVGGDYRIAALDLSGHGDSGRRVDYDLETWADEVVAVAEHAQMSGPPIVIGHSMGGFVSIVVAATHPDDVGGIVIVDSPVTRPGPEVEAAQVGQAFGKPRVYPDIATVRAKFRTVPPQEHYLDYVLDHVAPHSLRPVEGGFSWKFDHHVFVSAFRGGPRALARPYLPEVRSRVALLRSEFGLIDDDIGAYMYEQLGRVAPVVELPLAGHHPMLDQPLLLITAIRTLLADWDHSRPHHRAG